MPYSRDVWRPSATLLELQRRAKLLHGVRSYFYQQSVLEVETPMLSTYATVDPYIDSFYSDFRPSGAGVKRCYLHTSPEFPMKRLLASGSGDIYSLGRVFRNGEAGRRHNPEFTMLEWYRVGIDHHRLMDDVTGLLSSVCDYKEQRRVSYGELFEQYFAIDPHEADCQQLAALVRERIDDNLSELTRNDCLDLLFSHTIEPLLGESTEEQLSGVFVYDYPESMAALARVIDNDKKQKVAARFELFVQGVELANGYYELAESEEQAARFQRDQAFRRSAGLEVYPYDAHLVDALASGFPDCAGVAMGLDRLHMLLAGTRDIRDVLAFDFSRA